MNTDMLCWLVMCYNYGKVHTGRCGRGLCYGTEGNWTHFVSNESDEDVCVAMSTVCSIVSIATIRLTKYPVALTQALSYKKTSSTDKYH